ncbi:unnamed protein product [Rotaria sp. Silwood2]|nr:unnamed protein product [Rotaria sp. Silwood2]CAF3467947.1 unnamed protein product [Rotaria sp. Silwood2]
MYTMKVSYFILPILLLGICLHRQIYAENVDLKPCFAEDWIRCGIAVGKVIYGMYGSWSDIDEKQVFGTTCKSQFKGNIYRWQLVWSGKFWCPSLSSGVMGESRNWKSRAGAIEHAIQDYVTKMTSAGLLTPSQLQG